MLVRVFIVRPRIGFIRDIFIADVEHNGYSILDSNFLLQLRKCLYLLPGFQFRQESCLKLAM